MLSTISLLAFLLPGVQESTDAAAQEPPAASSTSVKANELKDRIHKMRMDLLLGGEQVRSAEREAVDFYNGKTELVERRLDTISAELTEKRATYQVTLDRALESKDPAARKKAMGEALKLRSEITALEQERDDLTGKRKSLTKLVTAVESRDRERERIAAQLETSDGIGDPLGLPLASVGLAPPVQPVAPASPLDDPQLLADLMARDPLAARQVLFEEDPVRYWQRFPLRPDEKALKEAFQFPLPDLPGQR